MHSPLQCTVFPDFLCQFGAAPALACASANTAQPPTDMKEKRSCFTPLLYFAPDTLNPNYGEHKLLFRELLASAKRD